MKKAKTPRFFLGLFLSIFLIVFAFTNKWTIQSTAETSRIATMSALVQDQTLCIDRSIFLPLTNDFIVVPEPSTFLFFLSASHQDDLNQRKVTPAFVEEFHRQEKSLAPDSVVSFKIQQLPQIDRTREWGFYLTSIDKDKKWFLTDADLPQQYVLKADPQGKGIEVSMGKSYSDKPPLLSLLGTLVYVPLYYFFDLKYTIHGGFAHYLVKIFCVGLPLLLFSLVLFHCYLQAYSQQAQLAQPTQPTQPALSAFLLTCFAIFASLLFPYSTVLNNHSPSACFFGIGVYGIWKCKKYYGLAGFCFALACCIDLSGFLMSLPFGLWMLFQRLSWKNWLAFWLGTLIPLLVHALAVIPVTGDLKPGALHLEYFSWQSLKQQEILTSQLARENLQEYFIYLYHLLVGQRGFFLHCPVALLGLWACLKRVFQPSVSASERGFTCSCFMAMLLVIGYYSAFSKTFGDFCYSIRWFLAFLPLLLFHLPLVFPQKPRPLTVIFLGFWTLLVTLPAFYNPYLDKTYHGYSFIYAWIKSLEGFGF